MIPIEKIRSWLETYEGFNILDKFQVDYISQLPNNGSIDPSGLIEVERSQDIMGNVTVTNQYNFGLYYVFEKPPGDDIGAAINADWVMAFQEWVQEQSVTGRAPVFGDVPHADRIMAQNGVLYEATEEGLATYVVQLSVQFMKKYEVK